MARKKQPLESFSAQLRNAIRGCGTTRYALARQLGISQSTLSRFLSGERGLTLDLVDKLADVLGLQIVGTVERVERPTRRGPKPSKEKTRMQTEVHGKTWWGNVARGLARDAWNNWESRRGTWHLEDVDKLCLYNNHPYARYPERRDEETAAFRRWLKANGIKELAYATYPETGVDAGATYAMIVDAGKDRLAEIRAELQRILLESNAADRMSATGP